MNLPLTAANTLHLFSLPQRLWQQKEERRRKVITSCSACHQILSSALSCLSWLPQWFAMLCSAQLGSVVLVWQWGWGRSWGYWEPLSARHSLGSPDCLHQVPNNWCVNAIRDSYQDVGLFQPGNLNPKASPGRSEGGGIFSREFFKHLSKIADIEEPSLPERT